jgi:hypothetical protein
MNIADVLYSSTRALKVLQGLLALSALMDPQ